jgi:Cytochrome c7 and related cytochrome c
MPIKPETGKDRWRRVPKDYFKTRDWTTRWKLRLSGIACILALVWWAVGVDWIGGKSSSSDLNSLRTNHGELARVHTAWENKCEACHEPFKPIGGRGLLSTTSSTELSSDKLCMTCHAGPTHHAAMKSPEVKTCAECHRDHQGRDFSMIRLVDGECTTCHSKLSDHVDMTKKPGGGRTYGDVTAFNVKDHPPFRPEGAKPGKNDKLEDNSNLLFNHKLHMMPGVANPGETKRTFESIRDPAERARYQKWAKLRGRPDALNAPIELDCSSCHVLDSTEQESAVNLAVAPVPLPSRNPGRYFLPINYQNQCRACHPLTFDPRPGSGLVEVPHGVQPDQVVGFLRRVFTEKAVADDAGLLDRKVTRIPLPGKRPDQPKASKLLEESVKTTSQSLFETRTGCVECHVYKSGGEGVVPTVVPTKVPEIWFKHAAFGHTGHRALSCRDCHPRSYALEDDGKTPFKDASVVAKDVLIPAIDNCVQCHAPTKKEGGYFASGSNTTGGASFDCTECHKYHNGDNPLQGAGALAHDADKVRTITEFLAGIGGQSNKPATPKPKNP